MKSTEFVTESINDTAREIGSKYDMDESLINFLVDMGQNCSEYLSEVGAYVPKMALYRGMHEQHKPFVIKRVRLTGRKPFGMNPALKDEINQYFTEEFGEPFRDSALCTGDPSTANFFGDVYAVFPVNGYRILWSPGVKDLNYADRKMKWFSKKGGNPQVFPDLIPNEVQYQLGDIREAIASGNEVMLRCERYYAISQRTALEFDEGIKEVIEAII